MFAKIINQETKEVQVGFGTNIAFYKSLGMTEMDVEQSYNGNWYIKGYAPQKPEAVINAEKVAEARKYLQDTDYICCKIIEGVATKEDYADIIQKREEARELIRSLENN